MTTAITNWDVGDEVPLTLDYTVDDVATDADTVGLTLYPPDGTTPITKTLADMTHLGTGSYLYEWLSAGLVAGTWEVVWSVNAGGTHPVVERSYVYLVAVP